MHNINTIKHYKKVDISKIRDYTSCNE